MFERIKKFFTRYSVLNRKIERLEERNKILIDRLEEKLEILGKICMKRESKEILSGNYFFIGSSDRPVEDEMQKKRDKARIEGYSFCHKKKNGDEIWVKY